MAKIFETDQIKSQIPNFPLDVPLELPDQLSLPADKQHFLLFIPWDEKYLNFVPKEYRAFYLEILPHLAARTTDVHTAVCMQYLDEFIDQAQQQGKKVNRKILAYALMLHDSGWSEMSQEEVAASLGVTGLALTQDAMGPKEKHAVLGERFARKTLSEQQVELGLNDGEIDLICKAILFHDKPEAVAGSGENMPIEVQLLVDLDHLWSFTHLNFWQDTLRKGVKPADYLENLSQDLDSYFVTEIGKSRAKEMLRQRENEVIG